ncbi:MAG: histidine--tRNA ligase, partial [Cyanobacteria bacterium]|nr:histidine--tRNA ligase [Cyanobacteriota bacterium]
DQVPTPCVDCQDRFERNPLRMLDCNVEADQEQFKAMPAPLDSLCVSCESQWLALTQALRQLEIPFAVNRRLVRGLDYYTRTVFEVVSQDERLGANSTVAAGGRYDNLVESLGGPPTPAVGWAVGLERLILLLDKQDTTNVDVYVVSSQLDIALQIATTLRRAGISADLDFPATGVVSRSSNKQFERAKKQGCRLLVKFGEDGQAADEVTIKDMRSRKEISVFVSDVAEKVKEILLSDTGIT